MPYFTISGVRNTDGVKCDVSLYADDEKSALAKAKENGVFPTRVRENKQASGSVSSRAFHALDDEPPTIESPRPMRSYGVSFVCAGVLCIFAFGFLYDTTVTTSAQFGEIQTVHNIGKQQNRLLGFIAGVAATSLGAVLPALDTTQHSKKDGS